MPEDHSPDTTDRPSHIRIDISVLTDDELVALVKCLGSTLGDRFATVVTAERYNPSFRERKPLS